MMKRLLPFLMLLVSASALAESGAYRIEVIVFRNLAVETEALTAESLRSFAQFPSLEEPQTLFIQDEIVSGQTGANLPESSSSNVTDDVTGDMSDGLPANLRADLPDDLYVLEQRTPYMDDVWRRLRSSQGYRPLVYAAWEQNRTDFYPPMRMHDQQLIDTQLQAPATIMVADLTAADPLAAYRNNFYQLDGTVQLRRSRFLHLYLDLEYRLEQPQAQTESDAGFFTATNSLPFLGAEAEMGTTSGLFTLKQNRQVRTSELQYFDTPYFGALVLVTAVASQ